MNFFSILNVSDEKYHPMYYNFIHHLKKVGLLDKHTLINVDGVTDNFNTPGFNDVVYKKLEITHKELLKGNTVFCSDLDIVFLKDPLEYMVSFLDTHDIVFQKDHEKYCTGFFLVKPGALTIDLFDRSEKIQFDREKIKGRDFVARCDQGYINSKLNHKAEIYRDLKIKVLDIDLFPYGKRWYEAPGNSYVPKDPYMVHYNWIIGTDNKINRMKKYGHWYE